MTADSLDLDSRILDIDPRVANRKAGRAKGSPAHEVLAASLGIETVGQLLRHYPRRYIDRSNTASIRAIQSAARPPKQPTLVVAGAADPPIRLGQEATVIVFSRAPASSGRCSARPAPGRGSAHDPGTTVASGR